MPKTKGMTSIEVAVLVAVILVIAVAVGWYLYSTFVASAALQPRVTLSSVTMFTNGTIVLVVSNEGPGVARLRAVEVAGRVVGVSADLGQFQVREIRVTIPNFYPAVESIVSGRVVFVHGSIPFNVRVR